MAGTQAFSTAISVFAVEKERVNYLQSGSRSEDKKKFWKEPMLTRRQKLERQVRNYHVREWLSKHSLNSLRRVELSAQRKAALRECFEVLDIDGGGTLGRNELIMAMRALGFDAQAAREAMAIGDQDGDGEMDFEEFVSLIAHSSLTAQDGSVRETDTDGFPFALIANSYRISQLVDSYNPALKDKLPALAQTTKQNPKVTLCQKYKSASQTSSSKLPSVAGNKSLPGSRRTTLNSNAGSRRPTINSNAGSRRTTITMTPVGPP